MKSILLIEDNDEIRENTAEILELSNFQVYRASDGKQGVQIALDKKPDLVVCDIMMPVLDGYAVLHMLQHNPETENIPFIFLTAKTERENWRKGMDLGADDYITKPFTGTELITAIEGRLKKAEKLKGSGELRLEDFLSSERSEDAIRSLIADRPINHYRKKQLIYAEGNRPARMYHILKGKIKTYKSNEDGKSLVTDLYGPGDFLGYIALLEETNYKDSAEAMEDCELAIIPKEEFDQLLNKNPGVARNFIRLLAKNITEREESLLGIAYHSLRKKVAQAILKLKHKLAPDSNSAIPIKISRDNLAMIAGTATESMIRTLADFRSEGLIDIRDGQILVLQEKKLSQLLN